MTSRSRRLRNCTISTSQNEFQEQVGEEQLPSSLEPTTESNNNEIENNSHENELFLWIIEDKPIQELISNVPLGVIQDQWTSLIAHWCTEESKKLCEVNSVSAKQVKMAHTSGRKSYARKRKEMEIALGKEPDRLTFWEVIHKKKNGNFVNSDVENSLNTARQKFVELSQGSESDTSKLIDEAFLDIMGPEHNGRVKGLGLGPTLRSYYGVKLLNKPTAGESSGHRLEEVDKLKAELELMKNKMDVFLLQMDSIKALLSDRVLNSQVAGANANPIIDAFSPNHHQSSNASLQVKKTIGLFEFLSSSEN